MNIVKKLTDIYLSSEEFWHEEKLSEEESKKYFTTLLGKGRIITICHYDTLIGYVESWRINFEQFGRLVCHASFSAFLEDVETGPICYVANVWVKKEHRRGDTIKLLKNLFFTANYTAEYFVGEALRKKTQPVKVFTRQELYFKYFGKEGEITNGQESRNNNHN